jgi:hypothetical protein
MTLMQNLSKKWAGLRLAHQAVMMGDAAAVLKDNRAQNRAHSQRMTQRRDMPSTSAADEEMGIHVGDVHHENHYHGGNSEQTIAQKGSSVLKKAAIGAALIGTGVVAPYALPLAAGLLNGDKPAAVEAPAVPSFEDTNLDVELQIGDEPSAGIE